jgi:hypothetical protein
VAFNKFEVAVTKHPYLSIVKQGSVLNPNNWEAHGSVVCPYQFMKSV